jgi:thymidylate synthase (FAD)
MKLAEKIVLLKGYTPNPENVVAEMARICYADDEKLQKVFTGSEINSLEDSKLVRSLVKSRHFSQLEYANYRFILSGVSRSLTHQLVRHRMASFSQRSQRYVSEEDFQSVVPKEISSNPLALKIFETTLDGISRGYKELLNLGISREDARSLLPNACSTVIGFQMNARELLTSFFNERLCERAQEEIREISREMLSLVYPTAPNIFYLAGPSCFRDNKCYQGIRGCGNLKDVVESFKEGGIYKK